jgi:Tetratricopeptide repeat
VRGLVVACVVVAMGGSARAQAQVDIGAARAHFAAATTYFEAGRYGEALKEFEAAYYLSRRAPLLFNIGVCHERLGHVDEAISAFEKYLASGPPESDRVEVGERVAALKARAPAPRPRLVIAMTPPPAPRRVPVTRRPWFWAVMGGASAVVLGAVVAGVVVGTRDTTRTLPDVRPQ